MLYKSVHACIKFATILNKNVHACIKFATSLYKKLHTCIKSGNDFPSAQEASGGPAPKRRPAVRRVEG